jgi:hypothetical protein
MCRVFFGTGSLESRECYEGGGRRGGSCEIEVLHAGSPGFRLAFAGMTRIPCRICEAEQLGIGSPASEGPEQEGLTSL